MDDALKTRNIIYFNVESWFLFAPHQKFWLRAWSQCSRRGCPH